MAVEPGREPALPATAEPAIRSAHRSRRFVRIAKRLAVTVIVAVLAITGACAAAMIFGVRSYHWRAFEIQAGVQPSLHGETRLIFAPLGEVRAHTHRTPLALNITLSAVSFDEMRKLIASPPPRAALEADFQHAAQQDLRDMAQRQIGLGTAGAVFVALLLRLRRARYWLACAALGGGFMAALFGVTLRTFDGQAFQSPTYTGSLRQASWVIALVKDAFDNAETLSDKLRHVADNLDTLYTRINAIPGPLDEQKAIHVLHISDIHNNPAAVAFVQELAQRARADLVIDTGDLTDFGTPLEGRLAKIAGALKAPYVFVAGNHDSRATVQAVGASPNAIILNGTPVTVAGLSILGSPDPSSLRDGPGSVNTPPEALRAAGQALLAAYDSMPVKADIVAVHDPVQAQPLVGLAPLILCGHEHRTYVDQVGPTVICNAGTTGAAGARYFDRKQGVPFSAVILAFTKTDHPRLLYADLVVLDGSLGQYSVSRHTFGVAGPSR